MRALLLIAMLAACDSGARKPVTPPTPGSDVPATGSTAEKFDAAVATTGGPRTPPKVDATCQRDTDCVLEGDELVDQAPKTYACCPGCTQAAVNAKSYSAFQGWCETSPAPQCPPLGCVQPIMHAECEAGHCVAKPGATKVVVAPRTPPKVTNSRDGGCTLTDVDLEGDHACCPGCGQSAVNANSYKAFQAFCSKNPASQCPALGCAMQQMRAECEAGHCVAKSMRDIPKPP